mmetsp:Transcript_55598/g.169099  ORF Transcript_55598/g.169099 Transcript_55598/m.169099 type:complete len:227 (-) Transcript_55598:183-863(-)
MAWRNTLVNFLLNRPASKSSSTTGIRTSLGVPANITSTPLARMKSASSTWETKVKPSRPSKKSAAPPLSGPDAVIHSTRLPSLCPRVRRYVCASSPDETTPATWARSSPISDNWLSSTLARPAKFSRTTQGLPAAPSCARASPTPSKTLSPSCSTPYVSRMKPSYCAATSLSPCTRCASLGAPGRSVVTSGFAMCVIGRVWMPLCDWGDSCQPLAFSTRLGLTRSS